MTRNISYQSFSVPVFQGKHFLILFLLWPFLAFITALINYSQKDSKKVVYFFLIYYGFTLVIGSAGFDSEDYARRLSNNAELPFSDFFKIVGGIYSSNTTVDIVEPLISFIVSRFTSQHSVLFAVYAALFGFFYLKSVNLLHDRYQESHGWNSWIHLAFFTVILPITAINGFRMWTAAWIFFYGAYHVVIYHDARYLMVALGSSLVHFSFISANAILLVYFFAGNRNLIYLPIAISSFILPQLLAPFFQLISLKLGGGLQSRYDMYSNEATVLGRQELYEQTVWFMKIGYDLISYYLFLSLAVIQLRFGYLMKGKAERNLFSFLLLFLSFVNFGKAIPSFGARFQMLFFLFGTLYVFLYFLKLPQKKITLLTLTGLFPMVLYAAIVLRQGSETMNAWIFTPIAGLPLMVPGLTIYELLF